MGRRKDARSARFLQLQGAVGAHSHPVLDLEHLHGRVAFYQVGGDALVIWTQVLHQNEGRPRSGISGHGGEERLKCRKPPG